MVCLIMFGNEVHFQGWCSKCGHVGLKDTFRLMKGTLSPLGTCGVHRDATVVPLDVTVVVLAEVAAVVTEGCCVYADPKLVLGPAYVLLINVLAVCCPI